MKHRSPLFTLGAVALAFIIMFTVDVLAGPPGGNSAVGSRVGGTVVGSFGIGGTTTRGGGTAAGILMIGRHPVVARIVARRASATSQQGRRLIGDSPEKGDAGSAR